MFHSIMWDNLSLYWARIYLNHPTIIETLRCCTVIRL